MNEIEKLYENANVEKHLVYFECHRGRSSMRCCPINSDERDEGCFSCFFRDKMKEVYQYPPFTAEKQLELVKWLAINKGISINYDDRYFEWGMATDFYGGHFFDNFDECLADLVNAIWQDLTPEEKQQIKEILR